jgi:hypothetical protein
LTNDANDRVRRLDEGGAATATTADDIEEPESIAEENEDILDGFGSVSSTPLDSKQSDNEKELERMRKAVTSKRYGLDDNSDDDKVKSKRMSTAKKEPIPVATGDNDDKNNKKAKNKERYIQKYHEGDLLAEAIIVGGKPCFAVAAPKVGNPDEVSIILQESIQLDEITILKPFEFTSYINKPYIFKSKQEFDKLIEDTRGTNLDSLYRNVKSIWNKYVDADDFHISICAADTIFTYFQDKIGLTHYLFFVGGNNSGKSNNLTVLHFLTYRNMLSSGMTSANIYQFLGNGEEGVGTICEDEADNIDEIHAMDKMRIYKNGYTTGIPVFRTDTSFGRKQYKFNTFCFKAFAAERLPDSLKAKGFNQRTIELPCVYGFPKYDISEVANPAGDDEYQQLLDELLEIRNTLLVFRLLHFKDKIPDIKLNIQNREKQLFKPVLRIFQNTETTLNELLPIISKYVSQKRESNANTLHAFLYRTIKELIEAQDTYELESGLIWNIIKETLTGNQVPGKSQSYESIDFGLLSQKEIVQALKDVFGAERSRDKTSRKLAFDRSKIERLAKIYELSVEVKVVTHMTHMTHVGLDKHIEERSEDEKIVISKQENTNIHIKNTVENEKSTSGEDGKGDQASSHVSQASHVSPTTTIEEQSKPMLLPDQLFEFQCYYCDDCKANDEEDYKRHVVLKHPSKPAYPSKADLARLCMEGKGKDWEI